MSCSCEKRYQALPTFRIASYRKLGRAWEQGFYARVYNLASLVTLVKYTSLTILRHVCLWTSVHWSLMYRRLSAHWSLDRMLDKWNWGRQPNMSPDMLYRSKTLLVVSQVLKWQCINHCILHPFVSVWRYTKELGSWLLKMTNGILSEHRLAPMYNVQVYTILLFVTSSAAL